MDTFYVVVLHDKNGKNVEAEARVFEKYSPIWNRQREAQKTAGSSKISKVVKSTVKTEMDQKKNLLANNEIPKLQNRLKKTSEKLQN